jgi:hypothetical protein
MPSGQQNVSKIGLLAGLCICRRLDRFALRLDAAVTGD